MYNSILVPIDISEDSLTHMVIPFVQAHTALNTAKVHFLTVIPSLPYYSSLGLAYSVETVSYTHLTLPTICSV